MAGFLFRAPLLTAAGSFLVESDKPEKADVAVVFGGDEFGTRIMKAAQLATAGYAPYVLVSGPHRLVGHESDMTVEYARLHGYPDSLFRPLPHELNSTRAESEMIANYLRSHNVKKILLVTSNYHTARAARLMRKFSPKLQVVAIAAPDPSFTPDSWWKSREGQKMFVYEWLKTIATAFGI